jgi:hypothetical protein
MPKIAPGDLDVAIVGQLPAAHLPLGNQFEPRSMDIVGFQAPVGCRPLVREPLESAPRHANNALVLPDADSELDRGCIGVAPGVRRKPENMLDPPNQGCSLNVQKTGTQRRVLETKPWQQTRAFRARRSGLHRHPKGVATEPCWRASGSGLLPCGNPRHVPAKRSGKSNRFCLHLEIHLENKTGSFEGVTKSRWLEAAVVQPLAHLTHLCRDDFLVRIAATNRDRKHGGCSTNCSVCEESERVTGLSPGACPPADER